MGNELCQRKPGWTENRGGHLTRLPRTEGRGFVGPVLQGRPVVATRPLTPEEKADRANRAARHRAQVHDLAHQTPMGKTLRGYAIKSTVYVVEVDTRLRCTQSEWLGKLIPERLLRPDFSPQWIDGERLRQFGIMDPDGWRMMTGPYGTDWPNFTSDWTAFVGAFVGGNTLLQLGGSLCLTTQRTRQPHIVRVCVVRTHK